ncbi:helicase-associated domain-containing protein [Microbacterium pygmaeum]|uniref:Helicase conserved C-terminal domain-containing protein n=1 Tax=Microbacterium pygmaeum TaxID=370764 RepID=A0A1G7YC21_9MICO|nr:helicase-associated domain-containing protein [Microbacterium pygmaeum]SDG93846.1 Helicase conserved C-terminal domain-containing protein [Microbacterium pygmaeum]
MVSDERALATRLAASEDTELARIFAARSVSPAAPWHDFFDASAGLLDPVSVERAIARLPRIDLVALAATTPGTAVAAPPPELNALALTGEDGVPFAAVTERIRVLAESRPDAFTPAPAIGPPARADAASAAAAAERAFTTVGALADVLLAGLNVPLNRTGTGAVSALDRRRLTDAGALESAHDVDDLVAAAGAADLMTPVDRTWAVTETGTRWLESSTLDRWTAIAEGLRDAVPVGLRTANGGYQSPALWASAYPLDVEWADRAARLRRIAEQWGLYTSSGAEPEWTAPLRAGAAPVAAALSAHLPAEIDRVYLQADLTAIAPGPLAPGLDLRLRTIARRESRAQASTYRFSTESLGAGMTEGETAESIRGFLSGLSLTGIPQPLQYLIDSTAARYGLIRVREDEASARTTVEVGDTSLLESILVDHSLRPLGLIRDGDALSSRVGRDAIYWSLVDARYPVVAISETGEPESLHRRPHAVDAPGPSQPTEVYARLIGAIRAGHETDADAAWLGRELEQAVRAKSAIVVVVRMPDGSERSLTLEASGLGGGRLRGRDRGADVERTLPVSSIVSVHSA